MVVTLYSKNEKCSDLKKKSWLMFLKSQEYRSIKSRKVRVPKWSTTLSSAVTSFTSLVYVPPGFFLFFLVTLNF